jgi:hypothetical protein
MKSLLARKSSPTSAWGRSTSSTRKMPQSRGLVNKWLGGAAAAVADAADVVMQPVAAVAAAEAALGASPGVVATSVRP